LNAATDNLTSDLPSRLNPYQAVSPQIATEHGTSTKSYAQRFPIFTPKSIGKSRTAIA
jgi:hypothetical protein